MVDAEASFCSNAAGGNVAEELDWASRQLWRGGCRSRWKRHFASRHWRTNAIAISMDGKGAWWDNVFVGRLWRCIKYEEVYLRAYDRPDIDRPLPRLLQGP